MGMYLALRMGMFLAAVLPPGLFLRACEGLLMLGSLFAPSRRTVARNLAVLRAAGAPAAAGDGSSTAPGSTSRPTKADGKGARPVKPSDVYASYGRYWGELLLAASRPEYRRGLTIRVEGEEHLLAAAEAGPVCVLSAHLGNWDLLAAWLSERLPDFTVVVEELKPPSLYRLFLKIRKRLGCRVLIADGQGLRIYRHLAAGGSLGLMSDRVFGSGSEQGRGQRAARLAGGERRLPSAGADLARRAGATLLPVFLLRDGNGYLIRVCEALPDDEDPVQAFAERLESEILRYPEQWVVLYPLHDAGEGWDGPRAAKAKGAVAP